MGKSTCHIIRGSILSIVLLFALIISAFPQNFCLSDIWYSRDATDDDQFGYAIAVSGDFAIVGSRSEELDINGQNNVSKAGAVFFYRKSSDGNWEMTQKLVLPERKKNDYFGHSVSIYENLAVVGAIGKDNPDDSKMEDVGAVYLLQLGSNGNWSIINQFFASDMAEDAELGYSVSINGERILAGAPEEERDQNGRNSIDKAGAVYVFERRWWGPWGQIQKIVSPERSKNDNFGESLGFSGSQALIGAFKHNEGDISEAGAVYAFTRSYWSGWYYNSKLKTPYFTDKGKFGHGIHISEDYAIIGTHGDNRDSSGGNLIKAAGSASIYKFISNRWEYVQKLVAEDRAEDDKFGWSVNLTKEYAIVGAIDKDVTNSSGDVKSKAGAAYVFKNTGTEEWNQISRLTLEDPDKDDKLGTSVAFSSRSALVSSLKRDKPEFENEDKADNSGAVFLFETCQDIVVNVDTSICDGDSILLQGAFQNEAGIYTDIYTLPSGYDSIVVTDLTILPNSFTNKQVAICDGDSIWLGGSFQRNAGFYYDTLDAFNSCDSIIITELFITPLASSTVEESICEGDSIWLAGAFRSLAGLYYDTIPQSSGCPDVLITDLSIVPAPVIHADTAICEGTSIWLEGAYQTMPGTYYDTISGQESCDSIIITELSVTPLSSNTIQISICPGDSIWIVDAYISVPGTYFDTLINPSGCNRVMITELSFYPEPVTDVETRICAGDSIWLGEAYQTTPGIYYDTLTSNHGCDSIVISTLTVSQGQSYTIPQIRSICKGDSIWLQNAYQKTAGIYIDTTIIEPCGDTLLYKTTLNAYPLAEIDLGEDSTLCDGENILLDAGIGFESYNWNNGFATTQTLIANIAGTYTVIGTDVNGCNDTDEIIISYEACSPNSVPGTNPFEVLIYPNPSSGLLNINMGDKYKGEDLTIHITNLQGQIVFTKEISKTSEISLELSHLPKAMYYLSIRNRTTSLSVKVILK